MCACGSNKKRNNLKINTGQPSQVTPPKPPVNLVPSSNRRLNKIYR